MSPSSLYPVITILLIFLIALIGALLPLYLTPYSRLSRYGNAFAAGFLVAAAFVHLLPAAHKPLKHAIPIYPVDGLLALIGASTVFIFDHVARHHHTTKTFSSSTTVIAYVLAATLSFHSLVEGLTLGFSIFKTSRFTAVAVAIVAHKFFAALTLGSSLANVARVEGSMQFRKVFCAAVLFACITPISAILGAAALALLTTNVGKAITAALSCLSAGIFLYVAFVELLAEEFRSNVVRGYESLSGEDDDTLQRAATFLVAAASMSLLAVWA